MRHITCLIFIATVSFATIAGAREPLEGVVIVLDAGHGGRDPGTHGVFNGHEVYEAPYVADVARRLGIAAKAKGALVYFTRTDPRINAPINVPAQQILDFKDNKDVYSIDGKTTVRARTPGMLPRMRMAHKVKAEHPRHRVVFLSLHFDNVGGKEIVGTHFIVPHGGRRRVVRSLEKIFAAAHMLRSENGKPLAPVVESQDKQHGVKYIYILDGKNNPVAERVLIELGNFASPADVWRLRNPANRDKYATLIVNALIDYMGGTP